MSSKKKTLSMQNSFSEQETRKDIYYKSEGRPSPREVKSQAAQQKSNSPGTRKDVKLKMDKKLN